MSRACRRTRAASLLARSRRILLEARERRNRPGRDDKVLADWNGLMIAALAKASGQLVRPDWLALAGDAFDVSPAPHERGRPPVP